MTQGKAIELMRQGVKITHFRFLPNEWMIIQGLYIVFEDGDRVEQSAFWADRKGEQWYDGYSVFK